MNFSTLGLAEPIQRALRDEQYFEPTPIQAQAIPLLLQGRDLLGCAQTGTGKTAAFALPILQRFATDPRRAKPRHPRALVLVPTRELALQVHESFVTCGRYLKLHHAVVYGGVGQGPQVGALARGVDALIATPGRLLDLVQQGHAKLGEVEVFVLDEADQMLDLGFARDIDKVLRLLPRKRQNLFLSATMPPPIAKLADRILVDPARIVVAPVASTVDTVEQSLHFVERAHKPTVLRHVLAQPDVERALVFTRTKHGADRVAKTLTRGGIRADAIHGNKSQNRRVQTLEAFRTGRTRVLIATDIAARGIHVDEISHVINYDVPNVPEIYVHRIGRTARAGKSGVAISLVDSSERPFVQAIERLTRRRIDVAAKQEHCDLEAPSRESVDDAPRDHAPSRRERHPARTHRDPRHGAGRDAQRRREPDAPHGRDHAPHAVDFGAGVLHRADETRERESVGAARPQAHRAGPQGAQHNGHHAPRHRGGERSRHAPRGPGRSGSGRGGGRRRR